MGRVVECVQYCVCSALTNTLDPVTARVVALVAHDDLPLAGVGAHSVDAIKT